MPSAPPSVPNSQVPLASEAAKSETQEMTTAELTAHVLAGAAERVSAAVARLERMGVIDSDGNVLMSELPRDMRADSQTTVVTG